MNMLFLYIVSIICYVYVSTNHHVLCPITLCGVWGHLILPLSGCQYPNVCVACNIKNKSDIAI